MSSAAAGRSGNSSAPRALKLLPQGGAKFIPLDGESGPASKDVAIDERLSPDLDRSFLEFFHPANFQKFLKTFHGSTICLRSDRFSR